MRYSQVSPKKEIGAHYTPKLLADFVAENIFSVLPVHSDSRHIKILDPAVGDGELLFSLLDVFKKNNRNKFEALGFDTDKEAIGVTNSRITNAFPKTKLTLRNDDFLKYALAKQEQLDFFTENSLDYFDVVIANPPYVRTQIIGAGKSKELARNFKLAGRVDLYHAFIQGIAHVLRPGGVAGIIVSNRFLSTKSGASIRKNIITEFDILHIWDLGDTRLFEAAVLPAVLLVKKKNQVPNCQPVFFTSIYSANNNGTKKTAKNIISALSQQGVVKIEGGNNFHVRQGNLEFGQDPKNVWRIADEESEQWLSTVAAHTKLTFEDVGKIRVGVKTTADKVFIHKDWSKFSDNERPELLKPLTTHHIAQRFKATVSKQQKRILYPHTVVQGKRVPINLDRYPKSFKYLNKYRDILQSRAYLAKAGRQWYEIWVPQDPNAWSNLKVVFRDISEAPTFWIDSSGSIVNGDCYWIISKQPEKTELLWLLLAVGNSSFIEKFYDQRFHNKLYSGRRRFITQYVKEFPLPDPDTLLAKKIIKIAKQIYDLLPLRETKELEKILDALVWKAFGVSQKSL